MEENNSFEALVNPGDATDFFNVDPLPEFEPKSTTSYSRTNALWLMEFSRLIYRRGADETPVPADPRTRDDFLRPRGWRENPGDFFNTKGTQAALFVNENLKCAALVFRGTLGLKDMITDADTVPVEWDVGHVHDGFKDALHVVWDALKSRLDTVPFPVFFTGHSLGAALATLAAARCLHRGMARPAALYTFGSPRVGDVEFGKALSDLFHCRVVNEDDFVTTVPPVLDVPGLPTFHHVGQMHRIEHDCHLHIHEPNFDAPEHCGPPRGLLGFIRSVHKFFAHLLKIRPPKWLADHTPVNYTAHLEKASPL